MSAAASMWRAVYIGKAIFRQKAGTLKVKTVPQCFQEAKTAKFITTMKMSAFSFSRNKITLRVSALERDHEWHEAQVMICHVELPVAELVTQRTHLTENHLCILNLHNSLRKRRNTTTGLALLYPRVAAVTEGKGNAAPIWQSKY